MLKTGLLLAAITALFLSLGYVLGGQGGMAIALLFAICTNFFAYWYSDSMVLSMYQATPINPAENPPLYNIIERLSNNAGIPTPRAYIINSQQPNAFATGRNPEHAAVAVTTGLLSMLDEKEVAAVIAHEIGHIKNRDTLIMTITATLAGAIGMLGNMAFLFGGARRENGPGPMAGILLAILSPVAAMLVQFAISRTREYSADASGAEYSQDALALASALRKISNASTHIINETAENNPATAHLFIMNPLHGGRIDNLFSTHPNTESRIQKLVQIAAMQQSGTPVHTQKKFGPWG